MIVMRYSVAALNPLTNLANTMRLLTTLCILLMAPLLVQAKSTRVLDDILTLYKGESKVVDAPNAVRMSVGLSSVVSSTLLKNGEVVLIAESAGQTNMQVWFADGHRETMSILVVESDGWREAIEIRQLLKDIPGIKINTVGRRVVVDGNLEARDLARVNLVKERYDDLLVLAREITDYEQKMIYFDVKLTEFDRDQTEELGINWSKSFAGPSARYGKIWSASGSLRETWAEGAEDAEFFPFVEGSRGLLFGIGSEITSVIDLLEQTGAAITLAEPRLSARSGGEADLTVGGEVPVITSSLNGSSVEYKDYGIILGIAPKVDLYDNITARVSVSVSQLDLANAVEDQPAFKKRMTENDVILRPGETLVLAGLISQEEQVTYNNVKWLADIPILGKLFQSKSFTAGTTEMVIFITPQLITDVNTGPNQMNVDRAADMVTEFEEIVGHGLAE